LARKTASTFPHDALSAQTSHQPGRIEPRQHAFPHHRAPQGTDAADREKPGTPEKIGREEPCEQRSVQAVDGGRSQAHVEIAASLIRLKDRVGTRIRAAVHDRVAKSRNIAQPEIETLCADGREHVRGLSDEGETRRLEAID
jgi:hypothetical protein